MRKCIVILIAVHLSFLTAFAQTRANTQNDADAIKSVVAKLGPNSRLKSVVLNDGTRLKGFIFEVKDESFVLVDGYEVSGGQVFAKAKKKAPREIRYEDVSKIKPYKSVASGIGAGVMVGIVAAAIGIGALALLGVAGSKD
jgi:hypothetical protein